MEKIEQTKYEEKIKFAEKFSLIIEENGHPRISGLILGWLLVCDPPEQSFSDLVEDLQVSKASVSNMTRLLLQSGVIEKVRKPGERQVYFKLVDDAWSTVMERHLEFVFSLRNLALDHMDDEASAVKTARLAEFYEFFDFSTQELPALIKSYKEQKKSNS